ncbi:MAG: class I SAM-dependent methyltransferase [Pseudomonadales bacterium]|jgi:16S rRNA (guanine1516-N2)-methyltransferase
MSHSEKPVGAGLSQPRLAVFAAEAPFADQAAELACQLSLPLLAKEQLENKDEFDLLIWVDQYGIGLRPPGRKAPNPVRVDFVGGSLGFRGKRSPHTRELVAKAVGAKQGHLPDVLDATAGLGRDAFVLASLGCQVKMIERSPVVNLLLRDAIQRGQADPYTADVVARMQLIEADAVDYLASHAAELRPEVVYLDPMFPERSKSASVKKEMQILQQLLGADLDTVQLFEQALRVATDRVVVKRPRIAPLISEMKPHHVVEGKASRFDVYHVKALS